jgi:hypothetical protein
MKFKNCWCMCEEQSPKDENYDYFGTEKICSCGIKKEHIHCNVCGGIRQIG